MKTLIRVHWTILFTQGAQRCPQGMGEELRRRGPTDRIRIDLLIKQIHHRRQIRHCLADPELGDIDDPLLLLGRRRELTVEDVRGDRPDLPLIRHTPPTAPHSATRAHPSPPTLSSSPPATSRRRGLSARVDTRSVGGLYRTRCSPDPLTLPSGFWSHRTGHVNHSQFELERGLLWIRSVHQCMPLSNPLPVVAQDHSARSTADLHGSRDSTETILEQRYCRHPPILGK